MSAEDMEFEVKEDGSVTKVEMKDTYSKVEISKTDLTTGKELEGAKLQILNKEGESFGRVGNRWKTASGRETSGRGRTDPA